MFPNIFTKVLNKQAPLKKKILRYNNNNPFSNKNLRKAFLIRFKLKAFTTKKEQSKTESTTKRINFCANLIGKTNKGYILEI